MHAANICDRFVIGSASDADLTPMEQACALNVLIDHPHEQALEARALGVGLRDML